MLHTTAQDNISCHQKLSKQPEFSDRIDYPTILLVFLLSIDALPKYPLRSRCYVLAFYLLACTLPMLFGYHFRGNIPILRWNERHQMNLNQKEYCGYHPCG